MKKRTNTEEGTTSDLIALVADLQKQLALKDVTIEEHRASIEQLREEVALLRALKFAHSSEKKRPVKACEGQFSLFDEAEFVHREQPASEENSIVVVTHVRKKRGRKPISDALPREDVVLDIGDAQKICPCGCTLKRIGEEISEKLDIIPQKVVVKRFIRPKYACPQCEGTEDTGRIVKIQPMPAMVVPQGIVTPSLLSYILVNKFCDALPFYRQTLIFRRLGVEISRATMSNWALLAARACAPLMELLLHNLRAGPIINMDETPVQVLREKDRINTTKSYMWVARGGPQERLTVVFHYAPSRAGDVAAYLVGPDFGGFLQSDGYSGYEALGKRKGITHVGCLAHVRRKFTEVLKGSPKNKAGLASTVLDIIGNVYHHESRLRKANADVEIIMSTRKKKIYPLLEQIKNTLMAKKDSIPPQSLLGKAVFYALGQWERIMAYLEHPQLTPDNNAAENAIRPFAVGRKNWLFSGSPRGATASATLYSLIETAKIHGLNPYEYLAHVLERIPRAKTTADYEALLPWSITSLSK